MKAEMQHTADEAETSQGPYQRPKRSCNTSAGVRIFYSPHHRWRPGDYETWKFWAPIQEAAARPKVFADGTWGGRFRDEFTPRPGEIVAQEHWCSSGFANTDLDLQLKKHSITN